ncbi:ABC transporter substrate-binding protein [Candidatus Poribacteria bacterium]|nr:ABC transporter substrate-binding protein [Candidatus Poribacteria bacterium]
MRIRNVSLFALVAIAFLVVGLSGCERMTSVIPPGETEPVDIIEVTIGIALARTGDNAEPYGEPMYRGLELAREEQRLHGVNFKFFVYDNKSTVEGAKEAVQFLVNQGVPAIVGVGISTHLKEAFPIAQEAGVVAFSPISSAAGLSGEVGDYAFRAGLATNILIPRGVMQTHAALQYQSAAIIYDSADTYSTSLKDELTTTLGTANVDILATEEFVTTDADFMTQLSNINSMAPDVLFVAALSTQMVQIITQADALGVSSRLIVPDLTKAEVDAVGAAAGNAVAFAGWSELDASPKNQAFVQSYMDKYGYIPSPWAAQAYASLNILANAIRKAPSTDATAIRDALAETMDFDTVLGPFSFDPNGEAIYEQIVVLEVQDGSLQPLGSQ